MKRSDAVASIGNWINQHTEYEYDPDYIAGGILKEMEDLGMLPPTVELLSSGDYMPTKELLDYSDIDYDCAWEPEE